jgi:hypothetical protein
VFADYPVNQPVWLEKNLAVFAYAKSKQGSRVSATLRNCSKGFGYFEQLVEYTVGIGF